MWVEPCRAECVEESPFPASMLASSSALHVRVHGGGGWSSHGWVRADAGIDYHAPLVPGPVVRQHLCCYTQGPRQRVCDDSGLGLRVSHLQVRILSARALAVNGRDRTVIRTVQCAEKLKKP